MAVVLLLVLLLMPMLMLLLVLLLMPMLMLLLVLMISSCTGDISKHGFED